MDPPLEQRSSKRSLADDPQFAASLSALDNGLSRPLEQQIDTIDSLSEAMWSEVAAQWDAFAPATPRTLPPSNAVLPPIRVDTPFDAAPDLRFLYHSAEHDRALSELIASVTRRETVVVLTGQRGAGKTTLCRSLIEHLDRRTLLSVVTAPPSVDALLKRLLVDFGVISNDETARQLGSASHDDLSGALRDFLSSLAMLQASALVIVDDAHLINPEVWDELSSVCDMADGHRLLQLLLVGEPALKRVLRRSDVRDMARRVAFRVEVGPLQREEIHGYVPHRLAVAGRADQVRFDDGALRDVFSFTDGVPGAINAICDRALTIAARSSSSRIEAATVAEAANDVGIVRTFASRWRERIVVAAVLIVMLVAGAAVAGWVFREPLTRALGHWHPSG